MTDAAGFEQVRDTGPLERIAVVEGVSADEVQEERDAFVAYLFEAVMLEGDGAEGAEDAAALPTRIMPIPCDGSLQASLTAIWMDSLTSAIVPGSQEAKTYIPARSNLVP